MTTTVSVTGEAVRVTRAQADDFVSTARALVKEGYTLNAALLAALEDVFGVKNMEAFWWTPTADGLYRPSQKKADAQMGDK